LCSLQTGLGGVRDGERLAGVVHIHDTLTTADEPAAAPFARPVLALDADITVPAALTSVRPSRNHLTVLTDGFDRRCPHPRRGRPRGH
jgi:CBS domain containing-hemolysin-like protein